MAEKKYKSSLSELTFDKSLLKGFSFLYLKNIRLMILLISAISLFGIFSFISVPRNLNPEVNIPIVTVTTVLPGASPRDVESLITIPLENEVKKVSGLSTYSSSSSENVSLIMAEFSAGIDPKRARDEVRAAVDGIDLPADAGKPAVKELDFENIPVWTFTLIKTSDKDKASLMRLSDRIRKAIEELPEVDRVVLSGFERQESEVLIKPAVLRSCRLEPSQLSAAIKSALSSYPAGTVRGQGSNFVLSLDKTADSLASLRELYIALPCATYKLGEIAVISEKAASNQAYTLVGNAENTHTAVKFSVYKTGTARVDKSVEKVKGTVDDQIKPYGEEYKVINIRDYDYEIKRQFGDLVSNFSQTLMLVFLAMFLFYGLRQALVASLAIPFPILITFIVMQVMGMSINFISIFSLLIALGLFVDNAVVIIEAFTSYYKGKKFTPLEAGLLVWRDFSVPLFSINLVTVWAFLPLLIAGGIIGEFIKPLPIIVSASMFASAAIAILFTLPSMMVLTHFKLPKRIKVLLGLILLIAILAAAYFLIPKSNLFFPTFIVFFLLLIMLFLLRNYYYRYYQNLKMKRSTARRFAHFTRRVLDKGFVSMDYLNEKYKKLITVLVERKRAGRKAFLMIIALVIFSFLLLPTGLLKSEFFPKVDADTLYIQIELPAGTRKDISYSKLLRYLSEIYNHPGVETVMAEAGARAAMYGVGAGGSLDNNLLYTVVLKDIAKRQFSDKIASLYRQKFAGFRDGKLSVLEITGGPPVGADVSLKLYGSDLNEVNAYAQRTEDYLRKQNGVINIERSIKEGLPKIVFKPETAQLREHGLSEAQVGIWLRNYVSGSTLATLRFKDEEEDLFFRLSPGMLSLEEMSGIEIPLGSGGFVPVAELGTFSLAENPVLISREEGRRTVTVTASVLPGFSGNKINEDLMVFVNSKLKFEPGYGYKTGGANEENENSVRSILQAMVLSAILILTTMVVQLGTFRKAFLVMSVIPLAMAGVFFWFALSGTPLSFPALIGLLALFGIVIANSIVILDKINQNLALGFSQNEAIIDAGASRIEPILLTSFSSIVGLVPITLADPLWRGLGGAIIAGLSVSGILMLIFIPILYKYIYPEEKGLVS